MVLVNSGSNISRFSTSVNKGKNRCLLNFNISFVRYFMEFSGLTKHKLLLLGYNFSC